MFRFINEVLSLSNYKFGDFVDRNNYLIELDSKDTIYTAWSASYLDLRLKIARDVRLRTKCTTKRLFQFFPIYMEEHSRSTYIWNISLSDGPIFQSLWFYHDFFERGLLQCCVMFCRSSFVLFSFVHCIV